MSSPDPAQTWREYVGRGVTVEEFMRDGVDMDVDGFSDGLTIAVIVKRFVESGYPLLPRKKSVRVRHSLARYILGVTP